MQVLKGKLEFGNESVLPCEVCHKAKQTREPFPLSEHQSKHLGDLVHLDLWGPYKVTSKDGYKYFLTIVDDYSRAVWVFLLKNKTETADYIISFVNMIHTQFDKQVKMFRSDNGTEFVNHTFGQFCNNKGIVHQTSCAYTPQQNGVVERKHRHLLNVSRSLLFQGRLPLYMWSDCVLTATYLINRTPSSVLKGKSPYEMVYGTAPSLSHLRVFGCLCFATKLNNFDKFSARFEKCVFLGYLNSQKGYKFYSLDSKMVIFSRDVKFYEHVFPFKMTSEQKENISKDVNHLNFFDNHSENSDSSNIPNDDNIPSNNDDGSLSSAFGSDDFSTTKL